jgi:hypothetical protein
MMTPEEQLEWNLCKNDLVYFTNKYIKKVKYSPLLADFKLYPYQEDTLKAIEDSEFIVINTAREMGISSIMRARSLWKMLFTDNYTEAVVLPTLASSIHHLNRIRDHYNELPDFFKSLTTDELGSRREFKLSNGSLIAALGSTPQNFISRQFDFILLDGSSFMSDLDINLVMHVLKTNGKLVIASTLHRNGWFADMCRKAEEGDFEFTYIKLPYWLKPKTGRAWRLDIAKQLGENVAKVECDCSYIYDKEGNVIPLLEEE